MKTTVIIPVYNGEKTLPACLESLAAQTETDFGLLLVNDGSTDGSANIIDDFARKHPEMPLRMIATENRGAAEARNAGMDLADSEYLAFMDQDDLITPDYLASYRRAMEDSGAEIVCGGYLRVSPESGRVLRKVSPGPESWARFVVTAPWAHLYRTRFLWDHRIRFLKTGLGEDIYFTLMAYAHAARVKTIPDTGYHWLDNPDSLSNSRQKQVGKGADPFPLMNRLWEDLPEDGGITQTEKEYFLYRYIVWYLLFTLRGSEKAAWQDQYDRMIAWIREQVPAYRRNPLISLRKPAGEPRDIRLSVWGFNLLERMGISRGVLGILAK